jgi:histidinol dehydrogenase
MAKPKVHNWSELTPKLRDRLLVRPSVQNRSGMTSKVAKWMKEVERQGDSAVRAMTKRFDHVDLKTFEVSSREKEEALSKVSGEVTKSMERAARQIRTFHEGQRTKPLRIETSTGLVCQRISRPIERVGLYIPGGSAPLPSTVLMLGVPSQIAGCSTRVLCSPPGKDGNLDPHIIAAAHLCGIEKIFKIGGVQAIAAMAYGTKSVPKVDKIFGPGNAWVTEAKMIASGDPKGAVCDMPAGPSEVMVIADASAHPAFVAADLLSQAEHGPDSQVVLASTDPKLIAQVLDQIAHQLKTLPRKKIASQSLQKSLFLLTSDVKEAIAVSNAYAPEHLILQVREPHLWIDQINNAGSVFVGPWSPESVGDYASGTNHVLPTYGYARAFGGLSLDSFLKYITFQELTPSALKDIGPVVQSLAEVEGLDAHSRAVGIRLEQLKKNAADLESPPH